MITRLWRTALVRLMPWYDEDAERRENARTNRLVSKADRAARALASFRDFDARITNGHHP